MASLPCRDMSDSRLASIQRRNTSSSILSATSSSWHTETQVMTTKAFNHFIAWDVHGPFQVRKTCFKSSFFLFYAIFSTFIRLYNGDQSTRHQYLFELRICALEFVNNVQWEITLYWLHHWEIRLSGTSTNHEDYICKVVFQSLKNVEVIHSTNLLTN